MTFEAACSCLGVATDATLEEARKAYKLRAQLLHPDKHSHASEDLRAEADRAMAELNEAFGTFQTLHSQQGLTGGEPDYGPWASEPATRYPQRGECYWCGSTPAAPVTYRRRQGLLLGHRSGKFEGDCCRPCSRYVFREEQYYTFTRGWWSLLGIYMTPFALVANAWNYGQTRQLPVPQHRDPSVASLIPHPFPPNRPVLGRAPSWGVFVVIAGLIAAGGASAEKEANCDQLVDIGNEGVDAFNDAVIEGSSTNLEVLAASLESVSRRLRTAADEYGSPLDDHARTEATALDRIVSGLRTQSLSLIDQGRTEANTEASALNGECDRRNAKS